MVNEYFNRRSFLRSATTGVVGAIAGGMSVAGAARADVSWDEGAANESGARRGNLIGVSSYSFWHFDEDVSAPMDACLREAAETTMTPTTTTQTISGAGS